MADAMKRKLRRARVWPNRWLDLVDATLEEQEVEDTFTTLNGFESDQVMPTQQLVLQLLLLALDPHACGFSKRRLHELGLKTDDPFDFSFHSVRAGARSLLSAWIHDDGHALLRCLPGLTADIPQEESDTLWDDRPDEMSYPLTLKAWEVAQSDNIWAVLNDRTYASVPSVSDRRAVAPHAWEVLEILVDAWTADAQARVLDDPSVARYSLRLYSQLRTRTRARSTSEILAVILCAFYTSADTAVGPSMPLDRRRAVGLRLLSLLIDIVLAVNDMSVDELALEVARELRDLEEEGFTAFFADFPYDYPRFKVALLISFIDQWSNVDDESRTPTSSPRKVARAASAGSHHAMQGLRPATDDDVPVPGVRAALSDLISRTMADRSEERDENYDSECSAPPSDLGVARDAAHVLANDRLKHAICRLELLRELKALNGPEQWQMATSDGRLEHALRAAGVFPPVNRGAAEAAMLWRWRTVEAEVDQLRSTRDTL